MKNIREANNRQDSSIHEKIRKASFVPLEPEETKRFKYFFDVLKNIRTRDRLTSVKRFVNTIIQKPKIWIDKVDWKKTGEDASIWIVEACIEGVVANFVTHQFLGWKFGPGMILAHGFAIKQGLSIIWRIKQNGAASKLPQKD